MEIMRDKNSIKKRKGRKQDETIRTMTKKKMRPARWRCPVAWAHGVPLEYYHTFDVEMCRLWLALT